jgi:outer membrane protein TolC
MQKKIQIKDALISSGIPSDKVNEMLQTGEVPNDIQLPDQLKDAVSEVYKNEKLLNENWTRLDNKELSFTEALQAAGTSIGGKLNFDSLDQLNVKSTSNMMNTMASVSYEVTEASYEIYKNQVAMLIQKSYYDVLKAQKMLEAKNKAMERGRKQYEFAKASYEEGLKAKDDMLMAELYYKATQLEYRKAQGDLQNALTEFKKNINVPLDSDVVLTQVLEDKGEEPDLNEGLESGLKKRLEIRKGIGEVVVYDANFESVSKRYPSKTFQYREAELLKERARINYEKTILDVKNSIYQSYEVLKTTNDMLRMADDMADKAYENLEIAEYKYKEGFGVETSLLKKLDLEASAGTIIEVLAAEENLAQIEEKVIEITYSYNLAKVKYYNDIGKYIY